MVHVARRHARRRCSSRIARGPRDGTRPALLTGYGGFDLSHDAGLRPRRRSVPGGGRHCTRWPYLRGGGEYGEDWHRAGMLGNKQNVFDDFVAAAEWLIANGHAAPARLAITGGSNGGCWWAPR